jgi:DNA-damage-inducible protein D
MANTDKLAEVVAALAERDEEFKPLQEVARDGADHEKLWSVSHLKKLLGYSSDESIETAVNRAKIAASNSGISIKENFRDGSLFDQPGELFVTKYAAYLIVTGCDAHKPNVALALTYFALQVDRQALEDEKRLRGRLDVATENHKLAGIASDRGVTDFAKFNGVGVSALYGGKCVKQIVDMKRLPKGASYLDYSGSEELAANLFRITQTAAALRRQEMKDEALSCRTHAQVASGVRRAIIAAGNTPPELLPAATKKIDSLATEVSKKLCSR